MSKKNTILMMILILVFSCASALSLTSGVLAQENEPAGENVSEEELSPEGENAENNNEEAPAPDKALAEEAEAPVWSGIDEDQAEILSQIFGEMTNTGQSLSGWFAEGDLSPCSWAGVTCENGRVTELSFENAGFFTTFPQSVLKLRDLKVLRMNNTLICGPLPDTLFSDLPMLEEQIGRAHV